MLGRGDNVLNTARNRVEETWGIHLVEWKIGWDT